MDKYAALESFLRSHGKQVIRTTFAEIEKIVGQPLPASAKYPAWWSNNPSNNSMTKVWRRANFRTEQVDVARKTLVFRYVPPEPPEPPLTKEQYQSQKERVRKILSGNSSAQVVSESQISLAESGRTFATSHHPLRGALKGILRLVGGTDLSKPADPDWGAK